MPGRSCQRTCLLWWAPLILDMGGDVCGWAQLRVAWVACGRAGHQAGSPGNTSHTTAYGGVCLVPSYTRLIGREREGVLPAPSRNVVSSATIKSSSGGCKRWSAASRSNIPPGYVAYACSRHGAVSIERGVLRACSRARALMWREVANPSLVSCSASPIDRGRPDWLDVRHSMQ